MMSISEYVAAILKHDVSDPPSVLDHRTTECCSDYPTFCIRAAGVLRYNRESDKNKINLTAIPPGSQALTEYPMICEFCGQEAKPSLDLTWSRASETLPFFCCAQRRALCMTLVKQRYMFEKRSSPRVRTPTTLRLREKPEKAIEEDAFKAKEIEDHNNLVMELTKKLRKPSDLMKLPVGPSTPEPKSNNFRLSIAPVDACWTLYPITFPAEELTMKSEEKMMLPFCDHETLSFGICHHQHRETLLQKYYSNGMIFLTLFPDGSAQVFYPSGLLALVIVVTENNGRVCIVYDESEASNQPMRALFQSDGKATCYHSNRNIWLTLNSSGGQCLDETGSRVRRWSWSGLGVTPTPLYPVFLSLNETVGVRIFGKEQVFVSFLTRGQQAKFSVGSCCAQYGCETVGARSGVAVLKEDLFVKVARIRLHLVIQHLHQYLMTPTCTRLPKTKQVTHLRLVAQQLLKVSGDVIMGENERIFIHQCLRNCLMYR